MTRMMDADEREIYYYLKSLRTVFISAREICRHAGGKKRFKYEEDWGKPVLLRMAERGIVESDAGGHFRLKPMASEPKKAKRWVSPQIAHVLRQSDKDFSYVISDEDELDRYYDSL